MEVIFVEHAKYHRIQIIKYENNHAEEINLPIEYYHDIKEKDLPIKDIWLKMNVKSNEFTFYHRYRYSHSYRKIGSMNFNFRPKFFGLVASRGLVPENSEIPAFINKVIVEEGCDY